MVHNKNTLAMHAASYTDLGGMYSRSYEPKGKPMEVVLAIGVEPISTMAAAAPIPYGVSEVDIVGGIRGEPVELVKCETVDLFVPATAEIVIEGEIQPGERMDEGPFGEFTGYIASPKAPAPVLHVKAITHRNNPVLSTSCAGIPLYDEHTIGPVIKGAEYLEALRARGLPATGVCVVPETSGLLLVVAVKVPYARVAEEIAHVIWGSKAGHSLPYLIVVNDDVDPFNMTQVLHALATKCHPDRGIVKQEQATGISLYPWASQYERKHGLGSRAYFDCTWPLDWEPSEVPKRVSFAESYPLEIQKKALAEWQKYGY
jgi:4-hydroxy-3-polyprenylbenzoate decarboxylase